LIITAVAKFIVAIIASFLTKLPNSIAATGDLTSPRTAVGIDHVPIVTSLAGIDSTIAADFSQALR
tara:strand:+ start:583 stop:780 length:198 start_codon:yes stop_codon:yes gene_type:complete